MSSIECKILWPNNKHRFMEYLAGLIFGDGQIERKRITITDEYKEFLDEVKNRLYRYTLLKPVLKKRTNTNAWYLRIHSVVFVEMIRKLVNKLYERPTLNFIRGLFDADGTIYNYRGYWTIEISQKDPVIIANLTNSLRDRCMYGYIKREEYYDKRRKKTYSIYVLTLKRKSTVYRFLTRVGLRHIKHIQILKTYCPHSL